MLTDWIGFKNGAFNVVQAFKALTYYEILYFYNC